MSRKSHSHRKKPTKDTNRRSKQTITDSTHVANQETVLEGPLINAVGGTLKRAINVDCMSVDVETSSLFLEQIQQHIADQNRRAYKLTSQAMLNSFGMIREPRKL